jgi:broad specificity phosphatase PhoE
MKVFLIRHGVTNEASANKRQFPESPLSEEGIKQARAAAKRLLKEPIEVVLSSHWPRAKETAEIITSEIDKPLEILPGIYEKETNPILHGVSINDPLHLEHDEKLKENFGNLDWKFRDEGESMREVLQRTSKFRDLLIEAYSTKDVAVVSHWGFIRSFITTAILGDEYGDKDALNLLMALRISNTGITLMEYYPESKLWEIRYLNDHFHLSA